MNDRMSVIQLMPIREPLGETQIATLERDLVSMHPSSYDAENASCNPFPYPLDVTNPGMIPDVIPYYPATVSNDFSAKYPDIEPGTRELHQILRLR